MSPQKASPSAGCSLNRSAAIASGSSSRRSASVSGTILWIDAGTIPRVPSAHFFAGSERNSRICARTSESTPSWFSAMRIFKRLSRPAPKSQRFSNASCCTHSDCRCHQITIPHRQPGFIPSGKACTDIPDVLAPLLVVRNDKYAVSARLIDGVQKSRHSIHEQDFVPTGTHLLPDEAAADLSGSTQPLSSNCSSLPETDSGALRLGSRDAKRLFEHLTCAKTASSPASAPAHLP